MCTCGQYFDIAVSGDVVDDAFAVIGRIVGDIFTMVYRPIKAEVCHWCAIFTQLAEFRHAMVPKALHKEAQGKMVRAEEGRQIDTLQGNATNMNRLRNRTQMATVQQQTHFGAEAHAEPRVDTVPTCSRFGRPGGSR